MMGLICGLARDAVAMRPGVRPRGWGYTCSMPWAMMRHSPPTQIVPSAITVVAITEGRPMASPCRNRHSAGVEMMPRRCR